MVVHLEKRRALVIASVVLLAVLGATQAWLARTAANQSRDMVNAPRFEVDPLWPKPLPNHWVLGAAIGVAVDADDHVWIVHRSSDTLAPMEKALEAKDAECCAGAPPVLEFAQDGRLLRHWGGPRVGIRMAGLESRHHDRLQRQRMDWWQRRIRFARAEVHKRRQVSGAVRQDGSATEGRGESGPDRRGTSRLRCRQYGRSELRPGREDLRRSEGERSVLGRWLPEQACGRHRRRLRRDEAVLGRLRQQAR